MTLYPNNIDFLQVSKILFLLLLFSLTSCQLDQSLDKIKTTLFEDDEQKEILKEDENEKIKTKENTDFSSNTDKSSSDDQLFIPDKIEGDERILDFIETKTKPKEIDQTLFVPEKVEDEKEFWTFLQVFLLLMMKRKK